MVIRTCTVIDKYIANLTYHTFILYLRIYKTSAIAITIVHISIISIIRVGYIRCNGYIRYIGIGVIAVGIININTITITITITVIIIIYNNNIGIGWKIFIL